ncbi:hypothetical protein [Deinococcus aquaticus]|uniref:hypothetical protein n=1 Tax=Deinococcus aquaticus TaxID=328692 RepID=UPI003F465C08
MKKQLLILLTGPLALGAATSTQTTALDAWADHYLPELLRQAQSVLRGNVTRDSLGKLAESAVKAAQELQGIFAGTSRAKIAQAVFVVAARAALPDGIERWIMPFLEGEALAELIESAFLRVFPAPVVDADDVVPGGVQ